VRAHWPAIRAALIALVLCLVTIEALPLPMLSKRHMRRTVAVEEVDRWVGIMGSLGIETTRDALVDRTIALSKRSLAIRRQIIRPFRRLERIFGAGQAWGLFTFADPYPGRLVIEATRGGNAWFPLYRDPFSDGSRLAQTVRHRRVRGVWDDAGDRPNPGKLYDRFVTWLSKRIFAEDPSIQAVRVRLDRVTVRTPNQPEAKGPDKPRHIRQRWRGGKR
jgi:hypothetical protein